MVEVIVDFGLFELLAFAGLVAIGRMIFRKHLVAITWLGLSLALAAASLVLARSIPGRAVAAFGLLSCAVNVALLADHLRQATRQGHAAGPVDQDVDRLPPRP